MSKTLIIAEKPSIAGDLARALSNQDKFEKNKDYFESKNYVITSAIGHLLEIAAPDNVEVKRGKWSLTNLPVIPKEFVLKPIEKTNARLRVIQKLAKRPDIIELVNACDAGREGELIFTYIVKFLKNQKPIKRLWLQSMTDNSIRNGFSDLRLNSTMRGLQDAAICRSESDWLIGINGTRALTAFNSKGGGFFLTTVGRVQTPTLTLVVEREKSIRKFIPKTFWKINATFNITNGEYSGYWFDPKFKTDKNEKNSELKADRLWKVEDAKNIVESCQNQSISCTEHFKKTTQLSPLLFDLTSLQREANSRFGFSAKNTLAIAQSLYERHKAITYPRTDSRYLPEDYLKYCSEVINNLADSYQPFAKKIIENKWIKPNRRIFDNNKISDHFAIIPTGKIAKFNEAELKIYGLIAKRLLAIFYPPAEYKITTRITNIGEENFKTEGKILTSTGWLEVYGKDLSHEESGDLPELIDKETIILNNINIEENQTKPPVAYTEATLLSAMESAGKIIEDEELKSAMHEKGLGTPATRAQIIEGLILEEYLIREDKKLIPTAKAFSLMNLLKGLEVEELMSAELTAKWEQQLAQVEKGEFSREEFMKGIAGMAKHIVEMAKAHENDTLQGDYVEISSPCPQCHGKIVENYRYYQCQKCTFAINKIIAGRLIAPEDVEELLKNKITSLLKGFRSKMGRPFSAQLKYEEDKISFYFENNDNEGPIQWVSDEALGNCPKCQANVFESLRAYACENSANTDKKCDFRISKNILKRDIEHEQAVKLLNNQKTDLLEKFISKKGRPFKAFLILTNDQKIGFEFDNPKANLSKSKKSANTKKSNK